MPEDCKKEKLLAHKIPMNTSKKLHMQIRVYTVHRLQPTTATTMTSIHSNKTMFNESARSTDKTSENNNNNNRMLSAIFNVIVIANLILAHRHTIMTLAFVVNVNATELSPANTLYTLIHSFVRALCSSSGDDGHRTLQRSTRALVKRMIKRYTFVGFVSRRLFIQVRMCSMGKM